MSVEKGKKINHALILWSVGEIRHGQLWPVSVALTLIIACVFALSALAERMEQIIVKQGKDALTADLVYTSSNPIPQLLTDVIEAESVESALLVRYGSMAFSDTEMQLVTVKAVSSTYPLRGEFSLESGQRSKGFVEPGELWLDDRVFSLLNVNLGDVVTIGDADLTISGRVAHEPGLSFNPFQQMPTVYIHAQDIAQTGALQPGSRVKYNLFLKGDETALRNVRQSAKLTPSDRWIDQNSRSRTNDIFERTTQYLSLTVAIVIIMAATTLVLTCQNYVASRIKTVAMLKSLGAGKAWLYRWLFIQVFLLFLVGIFFGVILGAGLEILLRIPLEGLLPEPLPRYGITPAAVSVFTCLLIGMPALGIPLINLVNTSAATAVQSFNQTRKKNYLSLWLILVPLVPMFTVYHDNTLVWIVMGGIALLMLVLSVISVVLVKLISKLSLSASMKLAVSRVSRSALTSGVQFGALALSLMLLAVIWLVRTDLLSDWQQAIPKNAPNVFSINISPDEKQDYLHQLDTQNIERSTAYPIIRGRIKSINGIAAKSYHSVEQGSDSLNREINFTWASKIPERNPVIEGRWNEVGGVSVEANVAKELNLKIGDKLTFVISGQEVSAKVNTFRSVEWREMKPNFYFIFTPDVLESMPATWMVSYRVNTEQHGFLSRLSRDFPTVSILDIRTMGNKIQDLLAQIIWSVTVLAALGVVAGILLIFTLLRLSLSQRQDEIRLYRTLGASRKRITQTIWYEYGLMAVVAGIVASVGAEFSVNTILIYGFDLTAKVHTGLWMALPVIAFVVLAIALNSLIKKLLRVVYQ